MHYIRLGQLARMSTRKTAMGKSLFQKPHPHPEEPAKRASRRMGREARAAPSPFETAPAGPPQGGGLREAQAFGTGSKREKTLEVPATITGRGQTTVPAAIRKMLNLGSRGRVVFRAMADGTVVIARQEKAGSDSDPVIAKFLAFLEKDMEKRPQRIRTVPQNLVKRAKALVEGVEVTLNTAFGDGEP